MRDQELNHVLTLSRWDQLAPSAQEEVASAVAARLPERFRFAGLQDYKLDHLRHRVACFTWKEARFALVPGGPATLGYAPGSFHPTAAHQQSWEQACREFPNLARKYPSLEDYLAVRLTPLRQVTFQPFLLEREATELAPPIIEQGRRIYRNQLVSYPETEMRIAQEGFRFPTSDEWEYACAAGARTLWRWGDDCPMIPLRAKDTALHWDRHLRPNAFGLVIAADPYQLEFTTELGLLRGGDGGVALHHEAGRLAQWLTLASAYWFSWPKPEVPSPYLRRAYSLFS